jgi:putative Mn2+ efflux pump MntP
MFKILKKLTKSEKIWLAAVILYLIGVICLNYKLLENDNLFYQSDLQKKELDL